MLQILVAATAGAKQGQGVVSWAEDYVRIYGASSIKKISQLEGQVSVTAIPDVQAPHAPTGSPRAVDPSVHPAPPGNTAHPGAVDVPALPLTGVVAEPVQTIAVLPAAQSESDSAVQLLSDYSKKCEMTITNKPGGMFQDPVFYGIVHLSNQQLKVQPTLLVSRRDWDVVRMPAVTHKGAFGEDYVTWSARKMEQQW